MIAMNHIGNQINNHQLGNRMSLLQKERQMNGVLDLKKIVVDFNLGFQIKYIQEPQFLYILMLPQWVGFLLLKQLTNLMKEQ